MGKPARQRSTGKPRTPKRCRHSNTTSQFVEDMTSYKWSHCDDCRTLVSLGPSNDDSDAVRVEMRAAELEANMDDAGEYDENQGWWSHPDERDIDWENDPPYAQEHFAGYLARELATHDDREQRDADAWSWDPSRPVAGQYERLQEALRGMDATTAALKAWSCPVGSMECEIRQKCTNKCGREDDSNSDAPLTVSIDSTTVQIVGLYDVPAAFTSEEADDLADALALGADAARQAAQDGYHGPAVVLGLEIGEEPEQGVEFEVLVAHPLNNLCDDFGCLQDGSAYVTADDYEAERASEPDCRDEDGPEVERLVAEMTSEPREPKHCDDYIDDESAPAALRAYLERARSPGHGMLTSEPFPKLFADHKGERVRVVMASRLGDVGITTDLTADITYQKRVAVEDLANFGDAP